MCSKFWYDGFLPFKAHLQVFILNLSVRVQVLHNPNLHLKATQRQENTLCPLKLTEITYLTDYKPALSLFRYQRAFSLMIYRITLFTFEV